MDSIDRRNIVLTGFMGIGKSTIGRLLAERGPEYPRFAQLPTGDDSAESVAADLAALVRSDPRRCCHSFASSLESTDR